MNTPSPLALTIAQVIENALTPIFATMSAPLVARIEELEKANTLGEPTPEFVKQAADMVLADDKFGDAVMGALSNDSGTAVNNLIDEIKERLTASDSESVGEKVEAAIRNGSFNIEFSRY